MTPEQQRIKTELEAHLCPFCTVDGEPVLMECEDGDWQCPECEQMDDSIAASAGLRLVLCGKCQGWGSLPTEDGDTVCSKCEGVGFFIREAGK